MDNNSENSNVQSVKHTVYDSVFKDLFADLNNVRAVYLKMHPQDVDVKVDDIQIKTLKTILMQGIVNDLSFTVRNKLLMMVEAQTNWSRNIAFRLFEYAAKSLESYVKQTEQDVYGDKLLELPTIELYVLYTGNINDEEKIDYLSFANLYAHGNNEFIDVKVKVIYGDDGNDVLCQYAEFVRVLRMCFEDYGRTEKAVKEAIRICKDRDVLRQYLTEREAEVVSVMQMLFDQDYIWDVHVKSEVRQAREEEREKAAKVLNKTVNEEREKAAKVLNEEREKAEKREKAAVDNGIVITIESLRDYGISEAEIMRKIMEKHGLDRQAAERYMNMSLVG